MIAQTRKFVKQQNGPAAWVAGAVGSFCWSEEPESNRQHPTWKAGTLPIELSSPVLLVYTSCSVGIAAQPHESSGAPSGSCCKIGATLY